MSENAVSIKKDAVNLINVVKLVAIVAVAFGIGSSYIDSALYYLYEEKGLIAKLVRFAVEALVISIGLDLLIGMVSGDKD